MKKQKQSKQKKIKTKFLSISRIHSDKKWEKKEQIFLKSTIRKHNTNKTKNISQIIHNNSTLYVFWVDRSNQEKSYRYIRNVPRTMVLLCLHCDDLCLLFLFVDNFVAYHCKCDAVFQHSLWQHQHHNMISILNYDCDIYKYHLFYHNLNLIHLIICHDSIYFT